MSNASKSFTSMQATRSHRRDVNGMVGQWSTFNQMRTFLREICVPLQPADPLKLTASAALQNGLMFQPHSEDELFQMSNWTGRPKVRKHGGMAQSVGHTAGCTFTEWSQKWTGWSHFLPNQTKWSHGSVGRAHRSHRWGHRFESCCDHHNPCKRYVCKGFLYPPQFGGS